VERIALSEKNQRNRVKEQPAVKRFFFVRKKTKGVRAKGRLSMRKKAERKGETN